MTVSGLASHAPRAVDVAAIEHELTQLWHAPQGDATEALTTRACMANLIVFCRHVDEEMAIIHDLPIIVAQHPARVLLLVVDADQRSDTLEAYVSTHCRPTEDGQQVCSEHVTIRAGGGTVRRLPSVVRALLLGDLSTALWWAVPEAPPLSGELFEELAELAEQVIYDSVAWTNPLRQLIVMANWLGGERTQNVADLAWRRPKLWRRLIAQSLDPSCAPEALIAITDVHVEHGPHALTQAWLLIGWLALRLGWQPQGGRVARGPEVNWQFAWPHGTPCVRIRRLAEGAAHIQTVRIMTRVAGQPVTFHFHADNASRVSVVAEGLADRWLTLTSPALSRTDMVARQLPDLARDRLFLESMQLARSMAETMR